ncbi:myocardin isoform X2 [Echinops telfairi]|uniref:Myocardin isoform X2 n=1 Tax=Echinops telfairi TaxID=9371 RepID=A0AC55DCI3_ECHTE|nr:myocardin isoform X2 [Echinops telfairi]
MTLLGSEHSLLIRSKFRSVLQLRLQQRRAQEQLANQGIIPPLKSPTEFHEQRKHLESDKTEGHLKHKVRNKSERADLVNMHILQASSAERSIPSAQMKLKRARLADDLNEKIALRPGPLELVEKNILPVDSAVKEAIKGNQVSFSKSADAFAFEEDSSSDGLSPDQTRSDDPQAATGSPSDTKAVETTLVGSLGTIQDPASGSEQDRNDSASQPGNQSEARKQGLGALGSPVPAHAAAVKSKSLCDSKNRHKKPKDSKPKVKKLKYHQYIPPDQKAEKSPPPMDSAYARLLQQQQLFLQLQILSQQQQHRFHYPGVHPAQLKETNEQMVRNPNTPSTPLSNTPLSPVKNSFSGQTGISSLKPGPLPSNLDDLKVSELRQQLRIRGLPVSGTKTALMERLRPFQDCAGNSVPNFSDITTVTFPVTPTSALPNYQSSPSTSALSNGFYHFGSTSSSPPISPASSDLSVAGSLPDTFNDASPSFTLHPSPVHVCTEESLMSSLNGGSLPSEVDGLDSEKDKMLVEKQKVINELTWKLQQEQRQVEELRMQLQKQKRHHCSEKKLPPFLAAPIKQEEAVSSCPFASQHTSAKREGNSSDSQQTLCDAAQLLPLGGTRSVEPSGQTNVLSPTFLSPQCSPQHSPLGTLKSPQHISLPPSPNNHYFLPSSSGAQAEGLSVSSPVNSQACTAQNSGVHDHRLPGFSPKPPSLQPPFPGAPADSSQRATGSTGPQSPSVQQKMAGAHSSDKAGPKFSASSPGFSKSSSAASEITQPPSYEDAVKQVTRSQQMDELLDVLIESGEMPADAREDHSCLQKVPKIPGSSRNPSDALPKPSASFEQASAGGQLSFDHYATENDEHLEVLLNSQSPLGKVSDVTLLKLGSGEPPFDGIMDGFSGKAAEDLFSAQEILPGPLSPMHTQFSPSSADSSGLPLSFTESPWETMEWLDLTPPSSTPGFGSLAASGPSIFNIDFLDVTDLNLNSPMDLHLQHW